MRTRVLPREEWARVKDTASGQLLEFCSPEDVRIVVVEDGGRILASMAILRVTHFENLWVDGDAGAGVRRSLIRASREAAREWSHSWAMASVGEPEVADMVTRVGGIRVPVDTYLMPLEN